MEQVNHFSEMDSANSLIFCSSRTDSRKGNNGFHENCEINRRYGYVMHALHQTVLYVLFLFIFNKITVMSATTAILNFCFPRNIQWDAASSNQLVKMEPKFVDQTRTGTIFNCNDPWHKGAVSLNETIPSNLF